jgi:DNA-binding GntR family transcriptional regulator
MARAAASIHTADPTPSPAAPPPHAPRKAKQQKGWRHKDAVGLLRDMILSGELPPGERLGEVPISQRLGMSRTPVREAFRTLAAEGLVTLLPNRSVVVSDLDETESVDVFAVLGTLEALAGQQACQRMTPEQMSTLTQLQAELELHFNNLDRSAYTRANRAIHELMVESSNNAALILAWRMILPRAERARTLNNIDRHRWADALDEHRKIFAALAARDGLLLSSLMQDHFAKGVVERIAQGKNKVRVKAPSARARPEA